MTTAIDEEVQECVKYGIHSCFLSVVHVLCLDFYERTHETIPSIVLNRIQVFHSQVPDN